MNGDKIKSRSRCSVGHEISIALNGSWTVSSTMVLYFHHQLVILCVQNKAHTIVISNFCTKLK